jgi:hypothetical protein
MKIYIVPIKTAYLLVKVILHCTNNVKCHPRDHGSGKTPHGAVQNVEVTIEGGYHSQKETTYREWQDVLSDSSLVGQSIIREITDDPDSDAKNVLIFSLPENDKDADYIVVHKDKVEILHNEPNDF